MWVLIGEAENFNWSVTKEINNFGFLAPDCFFIEYPPFGAGSELPALNDYLKLGQFSS